MQTDFEVFFGDLELTEEQGALCIIQSGDIKITWNKNNQKEVDNAKGIFEDLIKQGFSAFSVGKLGKKGKEKITEFDPKKKGIILIAPMAGG